MYRSILIIGAIILIIEGAIAGTIKVPADYPTIQAGIKAAINGDTVLVADNTYYENINFIGKAIIVASYYIMDQDTNHINSTIIDGNQPTHPDSGSAVSFVSGEDTTSMICGFTITGGTGTLCDSLNRVGGGICIFSSSARIIHNKIIGNSIYHDYNCLGGGIGSFPAQNSKQVIIENNEIRSNSLSSLTDDAHGGGIYLPQGTIRNNVISQNLCDAYGEAGGAGIACCSHPANITEVKIFGNTVTGNHLNSFHYMDGYGGGVLIYNTSVDLTENTIEYNTITTTWWCFGAGIMIWGSSAKSLLQKNSISFNSAINSSCYGGGLYKCETTDRIKILNNKFEGNSAYEGGGICLSGRSHQIVNNQIIKNNAGVNGGGIRLVGSADSETIIVNNTIVGNTAPYGGGIHVDNYMPFVLNTILWGNIDSTGSQIYGVGMMASYSNIQGGWPGTGNINLDPKLEADTLSHNSPCIGAGVHSYDFGGGLICYCPPEDINGRGRPYPAGSNPDMGAWESLLGLPVGIEQRTDTKIPESFALYQNYPNPFNPGTIIEFALPKSAFVTLKVYNLLGEEVATLVAEQRSAGIHKFNWEARGLASGVYLYWLKTGDFVQSKKLILMR